MSFKNVSINNIWNQNFQDYTVDSQVQTSYPYGYNLIVSGTRDLNTEITSFTPSSQVQLYEIDLSEVSMSTVNFDYNGDQPMNRGILRIYNDYNLFKIIPNSYGRVKWQDNFYYPFPIFSEGFEYTSAGVDGIFTFEPFYNLSANIKKTFFKDKLILGSYLVRLFPLLFALFVLCFSIKFFAFSNPISNNDLRCS